MSQGEITPPCGGPTSVGEKVHASMTPALPPAFESLSQGRVGMQLFQYCFLLEVVEGTLNIRLKDKLRFPCEGGEDRFFGIVTGTARTKTVAVGFKLRLPFWFER